jgi:hypothetical protein
MKSNEIYNLLSTCLKDIITTIDENFENIPYKQDEMEKLFESMELFIELVTFLKKSQSTEISNVFSDETTKNLQFHLLSVLKSTRSAVSTNDDIMLQDLIVNELKDNLTRWRINVLPNLKKQMPLSASF